MIVTDKRLDWQVGATYTVWGLFDVHLDSVSCELNRLKADIQAIADDPMARVIIGGDFNDLTQTGNDPRRQPSTIPKRLLDRDDYADACVDWNLELLTPIKDKIDAYLCGNHEDGYERRHGSNVAKVTARLLGVPYVGYESYLRYFLGDGKSNVTVNGCLYHGAGGNSPVTKGMIGITRNQTNFRYDFAMSGHIHQQTFGQAAVLDVAGTFDNGRVVEKSICAAICGTYLKTYQAGTTTTYGARGRYAPAALGAGRVYIDMKSNVNGRYAVCRIN